MMLRQTIRNLIRTTGWELVRAQTNPWNTLLGLQSHPFKTIFDIGANVGQSAKEYRRLFPAAQIYCFEPVPSAYHTLATWAKSQNGKVTPLNLALGNRTDVLDFNHHTDHSVSSSLLETTTTLQQLYPQTANKETIKVAVKPLDELLPDLVIQPDLLVKMDVQGYEMNVIEGAQALLQATSACILEITLIPFYKNQPTFIDLVQALDKLDLAYAGNLSQAYTKVGNPMFIDAVFTKPNFWPSSTL